MDNFATAPAPQTRQLRAKSAWARGPSSRFHTTEFTKRPTPSPIITSSNTHVTDTRRYSAFEQDIFAGENLPLLRNVVPDMKQDTTTSTASEYAAKLSPPLSASPTLVNAESPHNSKSVVSGQDVASKESVVSHSWRPSYGSSSSTSTSTSPHTHTSLQSSPSDLTSDPSPTTSSSASQRVNASNVSVPSKKIVLKYPNGQEVNLEVLAKSALGFTSGIGQAVRIESEAEKQKGLEMERKKKAEEHEEQVEKAKKTEEIKDRQEVVKKVKKARKKEQGRVEEHLPTETVKGPQSLTTPTVHSPQFTRSASQPQHPPSALGTARMIKNFNQIPYPEGIRRPNISFNPYAAKSKLLCVLSVLSVNRRLRTDQFSGAVMTETSFYSS